MSSGPNGSSIKYGSYFSYARTNDNAVGRSFHALLASSISLISGADAFAHRGDALLFFRDGGALADLHLDGGKACFDIALHLVGQHVGGLALEEIPAAGVGRHAAACNGAEKFVQRQLCGPGVAIPESGIEGADAAHYDPRASLKQRLLVHLLPKAFDAVGVLPNQHRERRLDTASGKTLAPALPA